MPTIKLTNERVMALFDKTEQNYITSSLLIKEYGVTRSTAVKRLNKMIDAGLIERGEVQHKYYRAHVDYMTSDEIISQLIQHWNEVDHRAINAVPQRHGGKMTSHGSGLMTGIRYVIESLIDMGLIKHNKI